MVITPDLPRLPFSERNGVKFFELIAEPVKQELLPGFFINAFGYNGSSPGPTIIVYPGDYVQIRVHNKLSEPTSVHWHGLDVPNVMDGVPEAEPSPKIQPGSYFDYHFKIVNPPGTHMYHTHFHSVKQEMMGLGGAFIIADPNEYRTKIHRDYFIMLQEFKVKGLEKGEVREGVYELDPYSDNFNFFTMNGRCFPHTTPLEVRYGELVRIRIGNLMMNAHPIHMHGQQFVVTSTDGNSLAPQKRYLKNTILVGSGETYDVEFIAHNPGTWIFHCHIPHHMANNFTEKLGGMTTTIRYV
ncbi:FtsP/CotA-like multicopper oxidase with cupredoxin domain [Paenibacillus phyllosphaerae]|uniref:FtsP/CotA-like multicopper oxidase with cupredoxin domain n=1 Tax=Paenibacillus phyllosphaerae TaxID=274593 RepID=A0A7W5B2U7_9BACL|nr:copper oxidase [Paenibacillus phyllosphaerae]MBB3113418.1 FtsP/CotA-like multicopper oxidase with cupredoxin domain [Paenibacillus phyllosphaerae]